MGIGQDVCRLLVTKKKIHDWIHESLIEIEKEIKHEMESIYGTWAAVQYVHDESYYYYTMRFEFSKTTGRTTEVYASIEDVIREIMRAKGLAMRMAANTIEISDITKEDVKTVVENTILAGLLGL